MEVSFNKIYSWKGITQERKTNQKLPEVGSTQIN